MTEFGPIDLTPFEWMMWEDGGQPTPMTYTIRLVLSGGFDTSVFVRALNRAIRQHPLLRAHIVKSPGQKLQWIPANDSNPYLDIADRTTECRFPKTEHIDLGNETGLRVWIRSDASLTEVRFQFHHACCDGIGAYRVIEDILCAYDAMVEQRHTAPTSFRPVNTALLTQRHHSFADRLPLLKRLWRSCFLHPLRVGRLVAERPAPIHYHEPEAAQMGCELCDTQLLNLPTHRFTRHESKALRRVANNVQATTNSLLLRDLMLTLDEWNRANGSEKRRRPLRILIPISLRTKAADEMPAANIMSLVSVTGRAQSLEQPQHLLREVANEMALIRRYRVDLFWHEEARLACSLWGVIPLLRRIAVGCYFTSALSNMGKLFARAHLPRKDGRIQVGGLTVEAIDGAPPVGSFAATFGCHWYAGELVVVMNYDRLRLGPAAADQLMTSYVERLVQTAESGMGFPRCSDA